MTAAMNGTGLAALTAVLCLAVFNDMRRHRIPNVISACALIAGIVLHTAASGWQGCIESLAGAAIGLGMLLPFYLARGIAAGDVKLMAGSGALLGAPAAFTATLATLVAGAVLAVAFIAWRTCRPAGGRYELALVRIALWRETFASMRRQRFPYAAAIAAGVVFAVWQQEGRILLQ